MRRKVSEKSNISGRCVTAECFQQDLREKKPLILKTSN